MAPEAILTLLAGPAGLLWAILTLPRPARIGAGLGKLTLGALVAAMTISPSNGALISIAYGVMGGVTALLGIVDLAAVKIALQIKKDSEQHARQVSSEAAPGAPPVEPSA